MVNDLRIRLQNKISPYFNNLQLLILFQGLLGAFAGSYVLIYFYNQSFPLHLLPLLYSLACGLGLITTSTFKIKAKWSIILGFCSYMLSYASLLLPLNYSYYFYPIFYAFGINFFWVPYNYLYFKNIKSENALNSSVYTLIFSLGATLVLPLGGYLIKYAGYHYLFAIAALIHLIPVCLTLKIIKPDEDKDQESKDQEKKSITEKKQRTDTLNFNLIQNLKIMFQVYKKLRTITVLETVK